MRIATLLSLLFIFQNLSAQSTFQLEPILQHSFEKNLETRIAKYHLYSADISPLFSSLKNGENVENLVLHFPNFDRWNMELIKRDLLSENYTSQTASGNGGGLTREDVLTFGGYYQDSNQGSVALTLTENTIYGFVEKDGHEVYIEPLHYLIPGADKNIFIVYDAHDVVEKNSTCAAHQTIEKSKKYIDQIEVDKVEPLRGARMACFFLEMAIASDFSMFQKYGGVAGVDGHNFGVLNNVQTNYDNEFSNEILFDVVTTFTSDCSNCDPWSTSTNAGTLLGSFRSWGNGGGFGVNFDNGELWTDRNFNGGTVGVAYVPGICNNNKYHVLEDYTSNAWGLRVLTAHELGHNFDSGHDGSGSGFIMAPSVNNTNTWSPNSINVISNYIQTRINNGCLSPCMIVNPPIADFTSDFQEGCEPFVVNFFDTSLEAPTSWNWSFPGGIPNTSTLQNPTVAYPNTGTYDVILQVSNSAGTDVKVETNYITVHPLPMADFSSIITGRTAVFFSQSIGDTYEWEFGDGEVSLQENPIHTYIEDGVYTVTLTVTNFCGQDTFTEIITIITPPIPDFTANPTVGCAPLTVLFSDQSTSNTTDWLWSFPGGNPSTSTSEFPVVTYNTAGTYDVTLEASNSSGLNVITKTEFITVLEDPTSSFSYSVNGFTVDFTDQSTNGNSLFWEFGDGNSSVLEDPIHTYDTGGSYTVSLTVYNSCDTVTSQQVVDLTVTPVADISSDVTSGCAPLEVNFTDLSTNVPTSWLWSFPGGDPSISTDQNPMVTYATEGSYSVELIATNLVGSDTLNLTDYISVETTPTAGFSSSVNQSTATFTNSSINAVSYSWDFGDGSNSSSETDPVHTYSMDGSYTVSLTATNMCGDNITTETIVIANPPVAGATADVTMGCADLEVQYTDMSSSNTTSWSWSFPGGNPSSSTDQNPLVIYENAGSFDFTLVASNGTGTDDFFIEDFIVVDDVPNASFTSSTNNTTVSFANNSTNADSYSWDFGDGNNSNDSNPSHDYGMDGNYTVTLTASNDCGDDVVTQIVVVANDPIAGATASVTSGCADLVVQYMDQSSANTTSWSWSFPGGNPNSSNDQNPTVTYENAGTFDFTLIASNGTGSDQFSIQDFIQVDDVPNANFTVLIDDRDATFTNTTTNGDSYSWDFGDGSSSSDENPMHTYAMDGSYTVTLTATNNCGNDEATQVVNISNVPTAGATSNVNSGCAPMVVQFSDLSSSNTTGWSWNFPGGNPATSNDENPVVTYNNAGVFDVQLEVSNNAGSNSITLDNFIIVEEGPDADFDFSSNELSVNFSNTSTNANSYSWDFGDGNSSMGSNPTHNYDSDGTYTVVLTATNDCGTDIFEETITIVSQPTSSFSANTLDGCIPLTVQFSDLSSSNATGWLWDFPGGNPVTSSMQNPTVVYDTPGNFEVRLTVSNSAGSNTSTQQNYINVGAAPTASFGYTINGMTATFANQSSNGDSYLWDFGDGNTSTQVNPTHTYATEDIFTVILTVTNACGSTMFIEPINFTTAPLAGFSPSVTSGCSGLQVQFNDNSSGTVETWSWSFEGGTPSTSSEQNPVVTYANPGVYDVTLEVSSTAGTNVDTQVQLIEVLPDPTASFDSSFDELDYSFTNTSMNGNSYSWDFGDGNTSVQENPNHTYSMDGTYEVVLTVTNACGTDMFTSTVSAISAPSGSFSVSESNGCIPFEVTMVDESTPNVENWNWSFPGGNPSISQEQNPKVTYNTPGIYSITLEVSNSAGTFTVTRLDIIEVSVAPVAGFSNVINDNEVRFTNTSTNATSYLWDFGDGNTSMEENPIHVYSDGGSYEVSLTVTNSCGSVTETVTISISKVTLPSAGFSSDTNSGCLPFTVNFTDASSSNTETWSWNFEGGTPSTSTEQNPTVIYNTAGIFSVELVAGNSAGEDVTNIQDFIFVNDIPTGDFNFNAQDLTVSYNALDGAAASYSWDFGDGNSGTGQNPDHTYATDGTYDVILEVMNECGTNTLMQTIVVQQGQSAPMAGFSADAQVGCVPTVIKYLDMSTNNPTEWSWEFPGGVPSSSTEQNPEVTYTTSGTFSVSLIAMNSAGQNQASETDYITIGIEPVADFSFTDLMGGDVSFTDESSDATSWSWDFGDSGASNEQNPSHQYSASGQYTVVLTVENFCGTSVTTQVVNVVVTSLSELELDLDMQLYPNPAKNEFFIEIKGELTQNLNLELFNSLGQIIMIDNFRHVGETLRSYRVDDFATGTYFVRIHNEEGSVYQKLIITGNN